MSEEVKEPEEVVAVTETASSEAAAVIEDENAPASEQNDTVSKVHELQKRFYKVCAELYEVLEYIGEPMYNLMLQHYFEQYKRDYERANAAEFIKVDKEIEELKTERDRELEEVKVLRDKQKRELEMFREETIKQIDLEKSILSEQLAMERERQLEEVKLEHEELTAEIERKREKLNNDIDIQWETMMLEAQMKASRIIPQSWRKFHIFGWRFGPLRSNEAMKLAEKAAGNEISEYLARRAEELVGEDDVEAVDPQQLSKREYKRWQKQFEKEQRKRRKAGAEHFKTDLQADDPENAAAGDMETPVQGVEPGTPANTSLIAERGESD